MTQETWYAEEISPEDPTEELPSGQRGRFVTTRFRNHFTLIFDNGDMMILQPGTAAHFEGVCQGEEEDDTN